MDIQMEEYSTLVAESGRAFQLRAKLKRESSFPFGAMSGPARQCRRRPGRPGRVGVQESPPGNPDRAPGTGRVHAFAARGQGTVAGKRRRVGPSSQNG